MNGPNGPNEQRDFTGTTDTKTMMMGRKTMLEDKWAKSKYFAAYTTDIV